jgi:hypothetical protein
VPRVRNRVRAMNEPISPSGLLDLAGCTRRAGCSCEFCENSAEVDTQYDRRHAKQSQPNDLTHAVDRFKSLSHTEEKRHPYLCGVAERNVPHPTNTFRERPTDPVCFDIWACYEAGREGVTVAAFKHRHGGGVL